MAYSVQTATVGHAQSLGAASLTPTFGANLHANGLCYMLYGGRGSLLTVVDTGTQTWTKILSQGQISDGFVIELWTAPTTASGTAPTVTVTQAGANFMSAVIFEVTGLDTSGTGLDTSGTAFNGSANASATGTASGNSGASAEFVMEFGSINGGSLFTTSSGFTSIYAFGNPIDLACFYKDSTSGVAETGTISLNAGDFWCYAIGVWKLASGGGGDTLVGSQRLLMM